MKIIVNIETNEPADLIRVASALAGVMTDPHTGAADKPKQSRKTESLAANANANAATVPSSGAGTPQDITTTGSAGGPNATTATSPSDQQPAAPVTEADLIAAANAAAAKIGPSGPSKVKEWIAATFKCADGTPGKLKLVAEGERPALLRGLQEIAQGVKAI